MNRAVFFHTVKEAIKNAQRSQKGGWQDNIIPSARQKMKTLHHKAQKLLALLTAAVILCSACSKKEPKKQDISSEYCTESEPATAPAQPDDGAEKQDAPIQEETMQEDVKASDSSAAWAVRYDWGSHVGEPESIRVLGQYEIPNDIYSFIEENMDEIVDGTQIVKDSKDLPKNEFADIAPGELRNSDYLLYGALRGKMNNGGTLRIYADSDTEVLKDIFTDSNWFITCEFDEPFGVIGMEDSNDFYDTDQMEQTAEKLGEPSYIILGSSDLPMMSDMKKGDIVRYLLVWTLTDDKYYAVELMDEGERGISASSGMVGCMETLESGYCMRNCFGKAYDTTLPFSEFIAQTTNNIHK